MNSFLKWFIFHSGYKTELCAIKRKWKGNISLGRNVNIGNKSLLERYMGGSIILEDNVTICDHCKIATCGGDIFIGFDTTLGDYTTLTAQGGVTIGKHVMFADHVTLIANEHFYKNINVPIKDQGCYSKSIEIRDGTWIGVNATILQGTIIGRNCVVAAGSVVKGIFPDYCVIGGIPGRIIKRYDKATNEWL